MEKCMDWYLLALKRYAQFSGRSRRKEYWMYSLINGMIGLVLYGGGIVLMAHRGLAALLLILAVVYELGTVVPGLACGVRRLHDTGRSGWWILLGFVPVLGLALVVFLVLDSEPGPNQYGGNPKFAVPGPFPG